MISRLLRFLGLAPRAPGAAHNDIQIDQQDIWVRMIARRTPD